MAANPYTYTPIIPFLNTPELLALRAVNSGFKQQVYNNGTITKNIKWGHISLQEETEIIDRLQKITKHVIIRKSKDYLYISPNFSSSSSSYPWYDSLDGIMYTANMGPSQI